MQKQLVAIEPSPEINKGLLVSVLQLISGLVEEPDERTKKYIRSSELMYLICQCAKDLSLEVREASSLAKSLCSSCLAVYPNSGKLKFFSISIYKYFEH